MLANISKTSEIDIKFSQKLIKHSFETGFRNDTTDEKKFIFGGIGFIHNPKKCFTGDVRAKCRYQAKDT